MREWKHRKKPLYLIGLIVLAPKFTLWKLNDTLSEFGVWVRISEFFCMLSKPLRAIWGFIKLWCASRPWGKLWLASPVLILIFVGFTAFFINANRNRGGVYAGYYQNALNALNEGDVEQADFLFGKLIHQKNYKDNDQALFQALIAATANGNVTRAKALRSKLIVQREYEPAKRWLASTRLQQGKMEEAEAANLITMARNMVENAPTESHADYWKKTLAKLLQSQGEYRQAVEVLKSYEERDPEAALLMTQNYLAQGDKDAALEEVDSMMRFISYEDPDADLYLREKVEGLAIKAQNTADLEASASLLGEAVAIIERKRTLAVDRQTFDAWLGELYLRMFEKLLEFRDAETRLSAFEYFDRAIKVGRAPSRSGAVLNQIIDPDSGYPLLSGQILDVVVKRGGAAAHLARGMDSWVEGNDRSAQLHFTIADAIDESALKVMRYAALYLAREGSSAITVFTGNNRSSYQRSFDLLDLVDKIDSKQTIETFFDRCYIHSIRSSWNEIQQLVEPRLSELEGEQLVRGYDWLVRVYTNLEEPKKAEEYQRALQNQIITLREQQDG
jgi:tetratricopeptide (TPR) repeat protein